MEVAPSPVLAGRLPAPVFAACTCIRSADPVTGRIDVTVYDPFCRQRMHRISGSTLREPSYGSQR